MSVRRHVITGEEILFAPARAARPHAFTGAAAPAAPCPFCPGNEHETPPEIARAGDSSSWRARVFPNKYPSAEGAEVIVESPGHDVRFESIEPIGEVVQLYVDRYRAHAGSAYTALFKNEGTDAGSSISHVHSQLIPLPFLPGRIARERDAFLAARTCPLCADVGTVIAETSHFRWISPHASWMPYQQWVIPKRHVNEISALTASQVAELGPLLRRAARATAKVAPAFNWAFMNFPRTPEGHAYVDVLPRMTTIAGLELGTGTFVEIIDPAEAAKRLGS